MPKIFVNDVLVECSDAAADELIKLRRNLGKRDAQILKLCESMKLSTEHLLISKALMKRSGMTNTDSYKQLKLAIKHIRSAYTRKELPV
jgi:hypothetical protein